MEALADLGGVQTRAVVRHRAEHASLQGLAERRRRLRWRGVTGRAVKPVKRNA